MPGPYLRVGLRFPRSQARVLKGLIESIRPVKPPDFDLGLFLKAQEAAETGEPLQVLCQDEVEAKRMAEGFTRWGVKAPTIEQLSH